MPSGNKHLQKKNKSGKGFEYDEEGEGGLVLCTGITEGFFVRYLKFVRREVHDYLK